MEPIITEDTTTKVIENASKKLAWKEAREEEEKAPGILVGMAKPRPLGHPVDADSLKAVHRMRCKFEKHGEAFDAILYYLLSQHHKDLSGAIHRAHAYCTSEAGAQFYREICRALKKGGAEEEEEEEETCASEDSDSDADSDSCESESSSSSEEDSCTETEDSCTSVATEEVYDYSTEWARAARKRNGLLTMRQSFLSPEYSTLQALSRFSKRCY